MKLDIQITGLDEVRAQLGGAAKQVNYAASRALTSTAYAVNDRLKQEMSRTFQGGATAYTLRAFKVTKAERQRLVSEVTLRTDTPDGGTQDKPMVNPIYRTVKESGEQLLKFAKEFGLTPVASATLSRARAENTTAAADASNPFAGPAESKTG